MKLRVLVTLLLVAVLTKLGSAQGLPDVEQKNKNQTGLFAFGGVGPAIPVGNFGKQREIGFDFNTAAEYRFASGFSLRGMFDFSSFGFGHGTLQVNNSGKTYDLSGSNNLISLLVAGGYHASSGRIQPYGFAGFGVSFVSIPDVVIDDKNGLIDSSLKVDGEFSVVSGAGVDFIVNPPKPDIARKSPFIIYVESFYTFIPGTTIAFVYKLNLLTINLGIKTKF